MLLESSGCGKIGFRKYVIGRVCKWDQQIREEGETLIISREIVKEES